MAGQPPPPSDYPLRHDDDDFLRRSLPPYSRGAGQAADYAAGGGGYRGAPAGGGLAGRGDFHNNRRYDDRGEPPLPPALASPTAASFPRSRLPYPPASGAPYGSYPPPPYHNSAYPPPSSGPPYGNEWSEKDRDRRDRRFDDRPGDGREVGRDGRDMFDYDRERGREREKERETGELSSYPPYPPPPTHSPLSQPIGASNGRGSSRPWSSPWQQQQPPHLPTASSPPLSSTLAGPPPPPLSSPTTSGYTIREMGEPLGRDRYWDRRGPPPPSNYAQPPPPPPIQQPPPLLHSLSTHVPPPSYQAQRDYREAQFAGRHHPYRRPSGGIVAGPNPPAAGYPGRGSMAGVRYGRSSRSSSRSRSPSPSRSRSPTASRSRSRSPHTPSRSRSRSPDRLRSDSREPPLPRREVSMPLPPSGAYVPMPRPGPRSSSPPPGPPRSYVQTGGQPHPSPPARQPVYGQPPPPISSYSSSSFAGQPRMPSPSSHFAFQQSFVPPPASSHHPPHSPTYRPPNGRSSSPPPLASPVLSPSRSYVSRHSSMQTMRGEEEGEINEEDERVTPRHYPAMPPQRSQPSLPAPPPPQPRQQLAPFSSPALQLPAQASLPPPAAIPPPMLSARSVSQSSSASVASGVGEEQKAAGEPRERQNSNVPLPVTSVPSMFTAATSSAASPLIQAAQPRDRSMRDDKRDEKKEGVASEHDGRRGKTASITSTDSKMDNSHPSLFRSSTLQSTFPASSSSPSSFSVTHPPSLSSSSFLSSSASSAAAAAAAAAAASKKRKVGFGLGLATLEKQKVPTKEETKEEAAMSDSVSVKKEPDADKTSKPAQLFRAVSAPEPEQRQLSPSITPLPTIPDSPSSSHRSLSVAIPPPNGSGQPATAAASSMTSPVEPQPVSPAVDRKLNESFTSTMTSPFTSPFPSAPTRPSAVGTPPSLSSSLSPSPPSSPPLSPTPLSDMDEAAASSSLDDDRDKAESSTTAQVPAHLLLMSKHSLLAAIQKLDEQINAGEEERDGLIERAREWKKRTDEIRVKGERMGLGDDGQKEVDDEDEDYEEAMAEERRQREAERRQHDKEQEARRKEEQYQFEHFTVTDPTDPLIPSSARIYTANHQRADHAHHHFDRLYPNFFIGSASRPPPLERPSSFSVLSTLSDRETRTALQLPLYSQPSECALYQDNLRMFPLCRQRVTAVLARCRRRTYGKLRRLAAQYVQAEKRWLQEEEQRNAKLRNQPPLPRLSRNNAHMLQADVSGYTYDSYRDSQLTSRQYEQRKAKEAKWSRGLVAIPPMLIDDGDRRHSGFLSRNGYIEDAKEEERQYKLSNPWTNREKAVFESKYIKFPKQFRKIATYLPNKNVNDCVAYYYYSKLSVNYAELVRREQKRQRMEKRGRRRGEGGEEEEEDDEEQQQQQQQQQQQEMDAAAAGGPGGSGSGRMAAAGVAGGKKRVAAKPRVGAAKPRGMSRELIGLAIDLSNQGKGDRGSAVGGRQEEKEGRDEEGQQTDDNMDTDTAAGAEDGNEADTDEAMEEEDGDEGAGGKDDKLTDSTTLPTHLDLYDDEDEKEAQMAADTKADTDTRQPPTHTSDDDEEELIHPALTTETTSPKPAKKRRLSRSQQPTAVQAVQPPAAPQQSVLWTESERALFLSGLDVYGKNFAEIAAHVGSKSADKCKNFWNNNKTRLGLEDRLQRWKQHTAQQKEQQTIKQPQAANTLTEPGDSTTEADNIPALPDADGGKAPAVDRRSSVSSTISSEGQSSPDNSDGDEDEKGDQRVLARRSSVSDAKPDKERPTVLHWTQAEKDALLAALSEHGRDWAALSAAVPSRTLKQIKTWWQNNILKLGLKEMVEEVKRRKARESVAAAVSAASQAHSSGAVPPAALSLPTSTSSSLAVSPSMRATTVQTTNPAMLPAALSGFPTIPSLSSSSMPNLSSPVLVIPPSLPTAAVTMPITSAATGLPNAESIVQSEPSAAPFPFVSLPGQSSLIVSPSLSPAGSSASVVLSPSAPLMLMIPPTALSPATSPGRLSAAPSFVSPHLPQLSASSLLMAASAVSSPSALVSASASPSTAPLMSVPAAAVEAGTSGIGESIAVQPSGASNDEPAEMDEQLPEDDARAADVDNASVMAAPPTVIEDTHLSRSLPPSLVHTPINASTLVSPSSVFHSTSSAMDVDSGYMVTASRPSTGVSPSPSLPLPLPSIPHVPFSSIAHDMSDALAASTSSTPVVSALPSPAHSLPLSFMPSSVSRPLPETMSLASPNLSAIDRALMSPSPSPSVSSMKGAPPSPPVAVTDEEMEMERPLSPPASPSSTRRAMSTFSPLSHLAHHPLSSSPPSPASDKSSPVSSSPPSPTPSILSLHTLASPTIESRGQPPALSSAVSSPQQRPLPPPTPTRSILRGYQLKETAATAAADAAGQQHEQEDKDDEGKRRPTANSAGSSSSPSPKGASMDEEAKEESELETEEMRDDASMCTALSALPEPPSSPRQQATSSATPRSPLSASRVASPSSGMDEDDHSSRAEEDDERPVVHGDDSQQSIISVPASATATSSLLSPPLASLSSSSSSASAPHDHGSLAPLTLSRGSSLDAERTVSASTVSVSGDDGATVRGSSTLYSPASSPSRQESSATSEDAADGSSSLDMQSQP